MGPPYFVGLSIRLGGSPLIKKKKYLRKNKLSGFYTLLYIFILKLYFSNPTRFNPGVCTIMGIHTKPIDSK